VTKGLREARPLPADVVGAAVDYDFSATIEQALQWRRQARRLVVVTGASSSDQLREPELSKVVSRFKDRVTVELLRGRPTSVVLKRLGQPRRRRGWGRAKNWRINPMHWPMHQALRCRARSKRTGEPCRSPAVRGYDVCRMHGAGGGAPRGNRNALKHGLYTAEAIESLRMVAALTKQARARLVELA
jgi:hypothetical protein